MKTKRKLLTLAFCLLFAGLSAQVQISGPIYTQTWLQGSVYQIVGDAYIPAGEILTIEQGVTVEVTSGVNLDVYGSINAQGMLGNKIVFTGANWSGIKIYARDNEQIEFSCAQFNGVFNSGSCVFPLDPDDQEWRGGAISIVASSDYPLNNFNALIKGCEFQGNVACYGAAIACNFYRFENGIVEILENNFIENNAAMGGAIYISGPSELNNTCLIKQNNFVDNSADSYGGAILIENYPRVEIGLNLIQGNTAGERGGGIFTISETYILNNLIKANNSPEGAAIALVDGPGASESKIANNTMVFNVGSFTIFKEIIFETDSAFVNNIMYNNECPDQFSFLDEIEADKSILHNDIEGLGEIGGVIGDKLEDNNISEDPIFIDPKPDINGGDFGLKSGSPCIDAGIIIPKKYDVDLNNDLRISGYECAIDIGAYEFQTGGKVYVISGTILTQTWTIYNVYKITANAQIPAGETLTIEPGVRVEFESDIKLDVYGSLYAYGEKECPIIFTAIDTNNAWSGVRIHASNNQGIFFNHTHFSYAEKDYPTSWTCISGGYENSGGAIFIIASLTPPQYNFNVSITNCTFHNNKALRGGAIAGTFYSLSSSMINISNNHFYDNHAYAGGALFIQGGFSNNSCNIRYNLFENNIADYTGGALFVDRGDYIHVAWNEFYGNQTQGVSSIGGPYSGGGAITLCNTNDKVSIQGNEVHNNYSATNGGGILSSKWSDANITYNQIFDNESAEGGGGIACIVGSTSLIENNEITLNTSNTEGGGGIACINSTPTIKNNEITKNTSYAKGGGIYVAKDDQYYTTQTKTEIGLNLITANTAVDSGGGIYAAYRTDIINNLIKGNHANTGGGIVMMRQWPNNDDGANEVSNNTIVYDTSNTNGGGIVHSNVPEETYYNNIVYYNQQLYNQVHPGNYTHFYYNDIEGYTAGGTGNISSNPLFVSSSNFNLQYGSPCLDYGDMGVTQYTMDLNNNNRVYNSVIDLGAYEYQGASPRKGRAIADTAGIADNAEVMVYPVPARDELVISAASMIKNIEVYNILNKLILKSSVNNNSTKIDVSSLKPDIYFVKIETGNGVIVKKFNVIR